MLCRDLGSPKRLVPVCSTTCFLPSASTSPLCFLTSLCNHRPTLGLCPCCSPAWNATHPLTPTSLPNLPHISDQLLPRSDRPLWPLWVITGIFLPFYFPAQPSCPLEILTHSFVYRQLVSPVESWPHEVGTLLNHYGIPCHYPRAGYTTGAQ